MEAPFLALRASGRVVLCRKETRRAVYAERTKDRSARANGRDITFEDGRKFFMGSSGIGAPYDERENGN